MTASGKLLWQDGSQQNPPSNCTSSSDDEVKSRRTGTGSRHRHRRKREITSREDLFVTREDDFYLPKDRIDIRKPEEEEDRCDNKQQDEVTMNERLLEEVEATTITRTRKSKRNYLFNLCSFIKATSFFIGLAIFYLDLANGLIINVNTRQQTQQQLTSRSRFALPVGSNSTSAGSGRFRRQSVGSTSGGGGQRSARLQQDVDALAYLQRYGYMNGTQANANQLISEDSFHDAVMSFQRFAGIPETGSVDQLTVKYMQMPRCGNKDRSGKGENGRRKKRYALQGSKWRRQELTYRISQYPTRFLYKKEQVDGQIERAFRIWSQVAPIDFVVKREGRVHIDIRFASGEHGDGDPFDGPGNTLAHAYFPQYGGDAHFDDQEYWTVDSYAGTNIFQVAAHELGHSLGLGHSSVREALMAPFYQKYKPNFKLHADDILGIQALYGERSASDPWNPSAGGATTSTTSTSTTTTTSATPTSTEIPRRVGGGGSRTTPSSSDSDDSDDSGGGFFGVFGGSGPKAVDLCQESTIDAVTRTEDGNTYVFRGQYYWQIKNEGLASGFPAKISRDWEGLPGNLDAALTWSDGKTFFFKGDKYWRFFNKRREPGYPKQISAGFAGIPNNVDAAFVWSGNGKTYFFKRDKYWRFDSKQEPPVSSQYPKSIKNWSGLPANGIDAAFKWENGMTYFFKDDLYYRFDDREFEVDTSARPTFPRSTAEWWFGCTNSNLPLINRPSTTSGSEEPVESDASEESRSSAGRLTPMFRSRTSDSFRPRPTGPTSSSNSISRSILSGLSSLFPSSSLSSPPTSGRDSSSSSLADSDWSFHRGIGEEVRRLHKSARSAPDDPAHPTLGRGAVVRRIPITLSNDNSRWNFPLNPPANSNNREQSLSELRMAPEDTQDDATTTTITTTTTTMTTTGAISRGATE